MAIEIKVTDAKRHSGIVSSENIQSKPHVEIEKESGNIKTRKKPNKIILDCQTSLFVNNQPGSRHRLIKGELLQTLLMQFGFILSISANR